MTRGDERKALWATSLTDPPRPDYDDVIVRVLEEPEEELAPPPREPRPAKRRSLIPLGVAVIGIVALVIALEGRGRLTIVDVPSSWGDTPMTCHTIRVERDGGATEWFWCRAVGGRPLPPGLYLSPDSQWTSDITRRDARQSRIRITRDGQVAGWAKYG